MRFVTCLVEVKLFLKEKDNKYPLLEDPDWLRKFYCMVAMTSHLNIPNKKMQGKGDTIVLLLEEVLLFQQKLSLFVRDLEKGTLLHFPVLKKYQQELGII